MSVQGYQPWFGGERASREQKSCPCLDLQLFLFRYLEKVDKAAWALAKEV